MSQRIGFRVKDTAGNKNTLSIIQDRIGGTVEVAYYNAENFPRVIEFVKLKELQNIISDVTRGATPDEIEEKYVENFDPTED